MAKMALRRVESRMVIPTRRLGGRRCVDLEENNRSDLRLSASARVEGVAGGSTLAARSGVGEGDAPRIACTTVVGLGGASRVGNGGACLMAS